MRAVILLSQPLLLWRSCKSSPMHQPVKLLGFAAAILLCSVSFPQPLLGTPLNEVASNLQAEAEQLFQDGMEQLERSQVPEAVQRWEQALEIYKQLTVSQANEPDIRTGEIKIIKELVEVYTSLRDPDKTIELSQSSLAIARELGDRDTELKLLLALGEAYNSIGKHEQAVDSARASLVLAKKLQNSQAKAAAFLTLASAYQSLASNHDDYQKATMAAISGLTTAWAVKDRDSEAKALAILGSIYNSRREKQNAILFAQQSLKVARENNIPSATASSLLTLSGVYLGQGKYQNTIESTEQGRDVLQDLKRREEEGATAVMEGLAYLGRGNVPQSFKMAERGLAIAKEIESSRIKALALIVLSLAYSKDGDSQKALELIDQSRDIAKDLNNRDLEALVLEVLGEIYRQAGQKDRAIAAYQEAISIGNSFSALAGVARLYQESDLLATAIAYFKRAVNKNEQQIPRAIAGLPLWLQESFPQAVQDVNGLATTNVYRSFTNLLLAETRPSEAQQVIELLKGQELREYTGNPRVNNTATGQPASLTLTPSEEQILSEYGSLISFGYRIAQCQRTRCSELEQLLQQREDLTKEYYQAVEELEAEIHKKRATDAAFVDPNQFALKAREIVEAQPGTVLIYPLVLEDKIWLMWASKGGIFKSMEVTNVSQVQLEETVSKFRRLLQNRLSKIDELQATSKQLYDWLLKPLEKELKANDIQHLVFALDRSTRYIPMSALFDGEKYLIENYTVSTVVSANLTDTAKPRHEGRVASMPSGSEKRSPTGGVSVPRQSVASTSQAPRFMLGENPKSNLPPSLTPPYQGRDRGGNLKSSEDPTVLAFGVSEAVGGFRELPNVPPELDAIVRRELGEKPGIYPGQEFLNREFNFFTLRDNLPNHQLLHIATHSKFVPGGAHKSFILLGTGERLAIPDIETWLNLRNVNLVVLSACQTALGGRGLDGREIIGVGYYFLKGGARTVIASLWNVDDYSTRLLMEQFYENLGRGTPTSPVTKAKAMREAQLALLNGKITAPIVQQENTLPPDANNSTLRHPYYWAPFILMGSEL